jgi:hypothetical protein
VLSAIASLSPVSLALAHVPPPLILHPIPSFFHKSCHPPPYHVSFPPHPSIQPQGETLFREGEVCTKVFFIVEGEVELLKRLPSSFRKPPVIVEHVHTHAAIGISEAVLKDTAYRVRGAVCVALCFALVRRSAWEGSLWGHLLCMFL